MVSAGAWTGTTSAPLRRRERILDVPRLSQMTYAETGGAGWCSPSSVAMVLSHAGRLPPGTDIPAAARQVHDPAWTGTGNWSFNTAWAAGLAGNAFVTRLRDLRDAERFVDAGIPLVATVAYPRGALAAPPPTARTATWSSSEASRPTAMSSPTTLAPRPTAACAVPMTAASSSAPGSAGRAARST